MVHASELLRKTSNGRKNRKNLKLKLQIKKVEKVLLLQRRSDFVFVLFIFVKRSIHFIHNAYYISFLLYWVGIKFVRLVPGFSTHLSFSVWSHHVPVHFKVLFSFILLLDWVSEFIIFFFMHSIPILLLLELRFIKVLINRARFVRYTAFPLEYSISLFKDYLCFIILFPQRFKVLQGCGWCVLTSFWRAWFLRSLKLYNWIFKLLKMNCR